LRGALAAALLLAVAPAPDAKEMVGRLLAAKPEERKAHVDGIVAAKPDPAEVAAALAAGRAYAADVPKGWLKRTVVAPDGRERPYLLHVPAKYDPAKRYRMLIDLHGGINRPDPSTHGELAGMAEFWGAEAEAREWILALPAGDAKAMWWDGNGAGMVLRILDEVRRTWNVDEDAVFATGFSDGASGAFHFAAARATPFAGFLPLNGNPLVAAMGGVPMFLRNLMNRPIYAVSTVEDSLYPSATMRPIFESLKALGAPLVWRDIPGFGHDPGYLPAERPAILKWMDSVRRDPAPKVVWWEGVQGAPPRIDWITVGGVTGGSGAEPFPDANPEIRETRVRLGVQMDEEFKGPGALITFVVDGSLAKGLDLRPGDILLAVDGADLPSAAALRAVLGKKAFGEDLHLRLRRGDDVVEKAVKLPAAKSRRAFERDRPFGTLRAEAKGNRIEVTCLGIWSFEVWLSPRLVDLAKPVEIVVNGKTAFSGTVAPDLRFMLERAAEDGDRSAIWWARVPVKVPL
jgi:hypothetical protein